MATESEHASVPCRNQGVLRQIEAACTSTSQQLDDEDATLSFDLKRRRARRAAPRLDVRREEDKTVTLTFPGNTAADAWRFTVVMRLLHIIHEALCAESTVTKRDIYYRDPALFGSQAVVDRYVEDLALTFCVPRGRLGVSAAAKGLIRGPLVLHLRDGSVLDIMRNPGSTLVPDVDDIVSADMSGIHSVLVVEKEATFQTIIAASSAGGQLENALVVTAKGYPDVATRLLLRYLCISSRQNNFCRPSQQALVDFDPDGLGIYSNYKYGSNRNPGEELTLPDLQLLGLSSSHLILSHNVEDVNKSMLTLTIRDRKRATNILAYDPVAQEPEVRIDIQRMLMLNVKVELQHLGEGVVELCENTLAGTWSRQTF